MLFTAWGAAGILGPMIGGRVFDAFGDYRYAFYAASALAIVAFASLLMAAKSGPDDGRSQPVGLTAKRRDAGRPAAMDLNTDDPALRQVFGFDPAGHDQRRLQAVGAEQRRIELGMRLAENQVGSPLDAKPDPAAARR